MVIPNSRRRRHSASFCLALSAMAPLSLCAASITVTVTDIAGQSAAESVVSLTPRSETPLDTNGSLKKRQDAVMDQWGREFIPYVLPIRTGTRVSFPNRDRIKHHVYSFSPAKRFELKLYSSGASEPVVFDRPGVVALGCNIHDWMQAWVVVLDTPYFAKTDTHGLATLENLPAGSYRVDVWNPRLRGEASTHAQSLTVDDTSSKHLKVEIALKRDRRRGPPPYYEDGSY
jgi:plastocyanin